MTARPFESPDRADKREAILDAALTLFAERGFHGTAVPLVAERAKVGAGTIYRYFENKEALVNAVYRQWKLAFTAAVIEDFPFQAPVREQFHALWTRIFAFATAHPTALAFIEIHHHAEYLDAENRALEEQSLAPARALLDETRRLQVTKDVPSVLLIHIVWGAFTRLVKAAGEGQIALDRQTLDQAEACLWEAIRR
jgi:AcrR family transcriptional regulator